MASSRDYKDYIIGQLRELGSINYRKMMGEYLLYFDSILFGGIYDDRLLLKIVEASKKYKMKEVLPYSNAKKMYLVEEVDNKALLQEIILTTVEGLKNK